MRVLHVANQSLFRYGEVYYAVERKLSNGFVRNGDYVYGFSDRDIARMQTFFRSKKIGRKKLNVAFLRAVENIKPELLVLGHTELLTEDSIQEARKISPGLSVAQWNVDPIWGEKVDEHLKKRLPHVDAFFCTTAGEWMDPWRTLGAKVHYLPNPVDPSIEVNRNFEEDKLALDVVYCGHDYKDKERTKFLEGLKLSAKSQGISFENHGCLGAPSIFGASYLEKLSQSAMGLNFSRSNNIPYYSSDRIAQLTGNGLLTLCQETPGIRDLFNDSEMIHFKDLSDLIDKVSYYKKNQEERKRIARAGWVKAHKIYNSQRIANFIKEISCGTSLSIEYEWVKY